MRDVCNKQVITWFSLYNISSCAYIYIDVLQFFLAFEKFTHTYLFHISLEIMSLPIPINTSHLAFVSIVQEFYAWLRSLQAHSKNVIFQSTLQTGKRKYTGSNKSTRNNLLSRSSSNSSSSFPWSELSSASSSAMFYVLRAHAASVVCGQRRNFN